MDRYQRSWTLCHHHTSDLTLLLFCSVSVVQVRISAYVSFTTYPIDNRDCVKDKASDLKDLFHK